MPFALHCETYDYFEVMNVNVILNYYLTGIPGVKKECFERGVKVGIIHWVKMHN